MDNQESAKTHPTPLHQQFEDYEGRAEILGELHARPFEKITVPRRVFLMAFMTTKDEARLDRENIKKLAITHARAPPPKTSNFHSFKLANGIFVGNNIMNLPAIVGMLRTLGKMTLAETMEPACYLKLNFNHQAN